MEGIATGQQDFAVVGFGGGDTPEAGREFVAKHGLSFPNLYDEARETWAALGVSGQPAWVLYDAGGALLGRGAGAIALEEIRALLP